ncbi:hypothetical protein LXA43DRAFT_343765 [Ganoderma leucocontextum]|nr:hypothetical protein LXA43DRAFT_343765 [Ganoderma leucocontextum]
MQLGASRKALNPWFKAFLVSVIDSWPDISTDDFQKTWFDLTGEERKLGYLWKHAGRPDDEGFAADFKLPEGKELPATTDDLSDGVDFLLQVDGSTKPIALNKEADTDLSSLTSPHLRLPDRFDFLSPEVLDELASALMDRMTMKQTEGFQPSDFATPRSSANRTVSSAVSTRPAQHTIHAPDRRILPLPSSSSFNSDVPSPSSPSPHDRQRDRDGFAIPSLPLHRSIPPRAACSTSRPISLAAP